MIIDCGSNIGVSILFFKRRMPEATIVGFEPDPDTYKLLLRNLEQNAITGATVHNAAVCETSGEIAFYADASTPGSLQMSIDKDRVIHAKEINARAVQLSSFVDGPVDLMKIDVEGAEYGVLRELASASRLDSVNAILMEYHHHIRPDEDRLSHLLKLLEDNSFGYHVAATLDHCPFQDIQIRAYNKRTSDAVRTIM